MGIDMFKQTLFEYRLWYIIVILTTLRTSLSHKVANKNEKTVARSPAKNKLKVTIFYESECSDCVDLFRDQLLPDYESYAHYVKFDFVPYGKATQKKNDLGNYEFDCQHGKLECEENKLQACAIDKLQEKPSSTLAKFILCYMKESNKSSVAHKCARRYKIDFEAIESCTNSEAGNELLAKMGDRTNNFRPEVNWVPTIVFNDVYNETDSMRAGQNFKQVLCEKLNNKPSMCKN